MEKLYTLSITIIIESSDNSMVNITHIIKYPLEKMTTRRNNK